MINSRKIADEINVLGITVEELTNEGERDDGMETQEEKGEKDRKNTVVKMTEEPGIGMRVEDEEEPYQKEDKRTNLAAGEVGSIDNAVWEKLTISDDHCKSRDEVEKVVGDTNKSLVREQLRTGQVKEEMKSSTQALLRTVCSSPVGNLNELTSRCEEHIPSTAENAKPVIQIITQYLIEGTACFQVLKRAMSDALYEEQELGHVVKEFM